MHYASIATILYKYANSLSFILSFYTKPSKPLYDARCSPFVFHCLFPLFTVEWSGAYCRFNHWGRASPWLSSSNPRDDIMPIDGDDGFYPTTGNELVSKFHYLLFILVIWESHSFEFQEFTQKPEVVNSSRKYRVRVLVCAPSNSALDEIVLRVLNNGMATYACAYTT